MSLQWSGGRLDETAWQGIRFLSIELDQSPAAVVKATVTAHLNQQAGSLTADHVLVHGGRRLPVPPHEVEIGTQTVILRFRDYGDHSPYTVELTDGGGAPLHPFFASAEFSFTIDCEVGDCRDPGEEARRAATQPPTVDLLTKDYDGFVSLLSDWVKVRNPAIADLSRASFERVLLDLLAWMGDMLSYHQDRVAGEAFIETASQRFSLRQHALLLGSRLDDGRGPTTVLCVDPQTTGFVPAGLEVRTHTSLDEVPVTFTVTARMRVRAENVGLVPAAFPGAVDAELPAGSTELLLYGHDAQLAAGDRLALVQGSFAQVVTLSETPSRLEAPGWVADPADAFDPATDPPALVTRVRWSEPLAQTLRPWADPPLTLRANLVDAAYGTPRRAVAGVAPRRGELALPITPRTSIVVNQQLRALRVPESPVVHDDGVPAVDVRISREEWTRVEHLHASRSYDLHYTAEADEEGAVWLRFGDGVKGREVQLDAGGRPLAEIESAYRIGDPVTGNVGLGTLVEIVRPVTGSDELLALEALGAVTVTNVLPATGGRPPHTQARSREELPASLRHGPLQRAVALADYATVAMDVAGVGRATARAAGGLFNTVMVLVDPAGAEDLDEGLRAAVHAQLDRLRMTGREHVVLAAEYVALEVSLLLCAQPGFEHSRVRDRVLADLRPGSADRPGYFHPDRLSFGDSVRLGDLIAFVQGIAGVRSVTPVVFRELNDTTGPAVRDVIALGGTNVARLDADPSYPENGTLDVRVIGLDGDAALLAVDGELVA
jgi:hypothetical protein